MLKSSFWLTLLTLFISVVSFINQVFIAQYFGASKFMDLYLTCSSVPVLIGAIFSTSLSYSLTPHLIKKQSQFNPNEYKLYAGTLLKKITLIAAILMAITSFGVSFFFSDLYPTFNTENIILIYVIQASTWLNSLLMVVLTFMFCFFNAKSKFILPLSLNLSPYIGSILITLFFVKTLNIASISVGLFLGTLFATVIILIKAKKEILFFAKYNDKDGVQIGFIKMLPLVMIAMLCFTIYQSVDAYWVTRLGSSMLSYLGYCQRILIAVGALVITGPSTVIIPRLTKAIIENRIKDFYVDVSSLIYIVISLSSLIAVIGTILAHPIVTILFQRGAFTAQDTKNVSELLPYMLCGMVFMLSVVLLFRVLFVKEMYKPVAYIGVIVSITYFSLSGIALQFQEIKYFGLVYIVTWVIAFLLAIGYIYKHRLIAFFNKNLIMFVFKLSVILFIVAYIINLSLTLFQKYFTSTFINIIIEIAFIGTFGVLLFIIVSFKLIKLKELNLFYVSLIKTIKK